MTEAMDRMRISRLSAGLTSPRIDNSAVQFSTITIVASAISPMAIARPASENKLIVCLNPTSGNAVTMMLRSGLVLIGIGILLGAAAGAAAARALRHLLHGITPFDPITFGAALATAAIASSLACYIPARRAASISPAELLRES